MNINKMQNSHFLPSKTVRCDKQNGIGSTDWDTSSIYLPLSLSLSKSITRLSVRTLRLIKRLVNTNKTRVQFGNDAAARVGNANCSICRGSL